MSDESHLDNKYFIDSYTYNCPFCNRNNIPYQITRHVEFDWSDKKECHVYTVECSHCDNVSAHYSHEKLTGGTLVFNVGSDLDEKIFAHQPTSFFTLNEAIPAKLRNLINEAEKSQKMNLLTGASACMRKAIYEFLVEQKIPYKEEVGGELQEKEYSYKERINLLKEKYPAVDSYYFDTLSAIQDMTCDKVHEDSWDEWDSKTIDFLIGTLKTVFDEIYVLPEKKKQKREDVIALKRAVDASRKKVRDGRSKKPGAKQTS